MSENLAIAAPPPEPGLIEPRVEALIKATGIDFRIGGSRAFYMPAHDYVQVPPPQAYFEPINWHRTALHELSRAIVRAASQASKAADFLLGFLSLEEAATQAGSQSALRAMSAAPISRGGPLRSTSDVVTAP